MLLTYIQHNGGGNQSGLDDFIFGQAASMVAADVRLISIIALILLVITAIFYKEFKLLTFDPQFAKGIGLPAKFLNGLLLLLIVCAVVIGLQTVGVVLMAAMLITPAISARYWTDKLSYMIIISGFIGGISGVLGTLLSTIPKNGNRSTHYCSCNDYVPCLPHFCSEKGMLASAIEETNVT